MVTKFSGEKKPRPLDRERLEQLALGYVARFAVSSAKLAAYLTRKLRERGWEGAGEPPVTQLVERCIAAGYVDDAAYARGKDAGLLARGYGRRRIDQALVTAGIGEGLRQSLRGRESAERRAALVMAKKRRFGPFGASEPDRPLREKQLAAMLRAGHPLDSARELVNASTIAAAEHWAAQASEDDTCD
ncbi:MAG: regulatory protein RecX [Novosphingobium sp.]